MTKDIREFSEAEHEPTIARLMSRPDETGKGWRQIFVRLRALNEAEAHRANSLPHRVRLLSDIDRESSPRPPK